MGYQIVIIIISIVIKKLVILEQQKVNIMKGFNDKYFLTESALSIILSTYLYPMRSNPEVSNSLGYLVVE